MQFRLNFRRAALAAVALLAGAAGFSTASQAADEWPTREITFYVPYAPGGSTDPISRKYAELLRSNSRSRSSSRINPGHRPPSAPGR